MLTFADWFLLLADAILLAFLFKLLREIFRQGSVPPFIRTRTQVAWEVAEAFGTLPAGSVVYDPGCGDGRVLFAIAAHSPEARCVGIELRLFPYLLARLGSWRRPEANVRFIMGNSFTQNFSAATHMYVYLYPKVMDKLLPKFERELRSGTVLISLDFFFSQKEAGSVIPLESAQKGKLGRTLYVYRF